MQLIVRSIEFNQRCSSLIDWIETKFTVQINTKKHLCGRARDRYFHMKLATYGWQKLGDSGNEEPNETLKKGGAYQQIENTTVSVKR